MATRTINIGRTSFLEKQVNEQLSTKFIEGRFIILLNGIQHIIMEHGEGVE